MEVNVKKCLEKICEKNKILNNVKVINTKFNCNRVFEVNNYIIKLFYGNKKKFYYNEYYIYNKLKGKEYISKMIDYGDMFNCKYIVLSKIKAYPIYEKWHQLSEEDREEVIKNICKILKDINNLKNLRGAIKFKRNLTREFYENLEGCQLDSLIKKGVLKIFYNSINKFNRNETRKLIYADFHFSNFLIDNKKNIYVIDFELLKEGTIDYQLASITYMCENPKVEALEEGNIEINDYNTIIEYFRKYYIEMFSKKNCIERIKLYNLIDDLRAVKNKKVSMNIILKYIEGDY
ncbi:MAG: phosphotransferase [Clostridia bacterium]|nr:phosphotransferase [Clostridia bacterium]